MNSIKQLFLTYLANQIYCNSLLFLFDSNLLMCIEIEFCKENVHVPFVYYGEWYLPLISMQNKNLCKWNEESLKYELIPSEL